MSVAAAPERVTRPAGRQGWVPPLAALAALVGLTGWLYADAIANAVRVWWVSPTFSHCFAVLPIVAWLLWERRGRLAGLHPAPWPWAVAAAVPLVLLALLGDLALINELIQIALIGFVQVLLLGLLGPAVYRAILFPALFLFFLVPTGEYLIGPLQGFTTSFVAGALGLLGVPVYVEGTVIQIPNGSFQVEEACAGLRFLIATIMIGALFSHLMFRRWSKAALFMAASAVVPVLGNAGRALFIVLLAHLSDNRLAVGADHLIYGWGFSVAILAVLLMLGARFQDPRVPAGAVAPPPPATGQALWPVALGTSLLIALVPAARAWRDSRPLPTAAEGLSLPARLAGWTVMPPAAGGWRPAYDTPDRTLAAALVGPEGSVDLDLLFYARLGKGHEPVESTNHLSREGDWHVVAARPLATVAAGTPVQVSETVLAGRGERRLVWSCYWIDRQFMTRGLAVKLHQVGAALAGRPAAALIALSTPITATLPEARGRLAEAVAALGDIGSRLAAAAGDRRAGQERLACAA